jgi:glycosyltransferase involved in cell wall biosynthesis
LYYSDEVEVFVNEPKYFREHWDKCKGRPIYTEQYNRILQNLKQYTPGTKIDIVYRQTYPYNLTAPALCGDVPIIVFYTSEFANLDVEYFRVDNLKHQKVIDDHSIREFILTHKKLYFTSPSVWSDMGLVRFTQGKLEPSRNRLITHGVDTKIYKKLDNDATRKRIRSLYNIKDSDIVLLNIGAMTQNKGILEILVALAVMTQRTSGDGIRPCSGHLRSVKLMLKGSGDLYSCKEMIENYMGILRQRGFFTSQEQIQNLLTNHIIFTEQTLTCTRINDLYNACDIYLSPYIAEGFNLTVLEAIAAGMTTIVSDNGSTKDFVNAITEAVPETKGTLIHLLPTEVVTLPDQKQVLQIDVEKLIDLTSKAITSLNKGTLPPTDSVGKGTLPPTDSVGKGTFPYQKLQQFLEKEYSWTTVCDKLIHFCKFILKGKSKDGF